MCTAIKKKIYGRFLSLYQYQEIKSLRMIGFLFTAVFIQGRFIQGVFQINHFHWWHTSHQKSEIDMQKYLL